MLFGSRVRIDSTAVWDAIPSLIEERVGPAAAVGRVVDICEASFPHDDWRLMRAMDWDASAARVAAWLPETLATDPPAHPIRGLYVAAVNYVERGVRRSDLELMGTSAYDRDDREQDWLFTGSYYPSAYARPRALFDMYALAYGRSDGLGNDAEWPLALSFACVAVAHAVRGGLVIPGDTARLGLAAGFHGGDILTLGEVSRDGFTAAARNGR